MTAEINPIQRISGRARLAIYGLLILAIGLRFWSLSAQSLWLDELWAIEMACGHDSAHQLMPVHQIVDPPPDLARLDSALPLWGVWTGMDRYAHPPGSIILLRLWMMIFGQTETSVRSLSAVLSVLTAVIFFGIVRTSIGIEAAVWAAAIFSVAEPQIRFAQDCRSYAQFIFETAVVVMAVLNISAAGSSLRRSIVLTLSLLLLLLTHYFSVAVFVAVGGFGLIGTRGRVRGNILICAGIAMVGFAALWGPFMWRQVPMFSSHERAIAFLQESGPDHPRQTCWRVLTMPMSMLRDLRPIPRWYVIGGFWYVLLGWLLVRRRLHVLWPILYVAVIALLLFMDVVHSTAHLAYIRYAIPASLAIYTVLAASIALHPVLGRTICAAATVFCLSGLPTAYAQSNADFRGLGQAIAASTQQGDLIVFAGPAETYAPHILYLAASYYAWPLPGPVVLIESPASLELMSQLHGRQRLFLVADPTVLTAKVWLPGYHIVAGRSWPVVGSLLEMQRDSSP